MKLDTTIKIIKMHETALRALGVRRLSLFGSVSRDEATSASDLDVLIERSSNLQGFDAIGCDLDAAEYLEVILGVQVDVVPFEFLKETALEAQAKRDEVAVF